MAPWESRVLNHRLNRKIKPRSEMICNLGHVSTTSNPETKIRLLDRVEFEANDNLNLSVSQSTDNQKKIEPEFHSNVTAAHDKLEKKNFINQSPLQDSNNRVINENFVKNPSLRLADRLVHEDNLTCPSPWKTPDGVSPSPHQQPMAEQCSYNMHDIVNKFVFLPVLNHLSSIYRHSRSSVWKKVKKKSEFQPGFKLLFWIVGLLTVLIPSGFCIEIDGNQISSSDIKNSNLQKEEGPICVDGIYRGNIHINNKDNSTSMVSLLKYENCSVVEGSISITSAVYEMKDWGEWGEYSLPKLVEITDFLLLYRADEIDSLETLFPNLAVIRGHKLVQFYALAIYQMKNMVRVGLPSLTHIMNGGVRIEKNPLLCYVNTVEWKKVVVRDTDKQAHIQIIDNQEANSCLDECPTKCDRSCWSINTCQRMIVPCPAGHGAQYTGQEMCYRNNSGDEGLPCHKECIGGCVESKTTMNDQNKCIACRNTRNQDSDNATSFTCLPTCPAPLVVYKNWMCITEEECSKSKVPNTYTIHDDQAKSFYKVEMEEISVVTNLENEMH